MRRKEEERRKAGEREREREREREGERKRKYFFNGRGERNLIKYIYNFFFLALMNSAHLFIDVHYSNEAKKENRFSSTVRC